MFCMREMSPAHISLGGPPTWEETQIKGRKDSRTGKRAERGHSTGTEAIHGGRTEQAAGGSGHDGLCCTLL